MVAGAPLLSQLSVGAGADVWGVDASGTIYEYIAATGAWNIIPGELNFVQVGVDGSVWGINAYGQTYTYNFGNATWTNIPGELGTLSVGADGTVWGINNGGQVYRYDSMTQSWVNVPGSLSHIAVGNAANIWGINGHGEVFRFDSTNQTWIPIPNITLFYISVAFDGTVFGMGSATNLYETNLYEWNAATQTFNYVGSAMGFGIEIPAPEALNVSAGNTVSAWAVAIGNYGASAATYYLF
jgi:virginiamycin B lyase